MQVNHHTEGRRDCPLVDLPVSVPIIVPVEEQARTLQWSAYVDFGRHGSQGNMLNGSHLFPSFVPDLTLR